MKTPSLRWRLTAVTLAVIAALVLALDAFIYLSLREQLEDSLNSVLAARTAIARELAEGQDPVTVAQRLTELGVPAIVAPADGGELRADPQARRFGEVPPGTGERLEQEQMAASVSLPAGGSVTVFVSRGGVESTLERVRVLELIGSVVALALAALLVWVVTGRLLRPVDDVVDLARGIASGHRGGRLRPERTDTELGRMAAAFDEMLDSLEEAVAEARLSEAASGRFLADAAHQLRTPVAGVRASAEVLLRDPDTPARDELLGNVARESARAGRLIRRLLRATEVDRDLPPDPQATDLHELVEQELDRFRPRAPELRLELTVDARLPRQVPTAADDVREAFGNLVENAIRHADQRVDVRVALRQGEIAIRIRDDGPGLPPGHEAKAFERFVSLDGQGGTGLGLSISQDLCRRLGGDLAYRDHVFEITVPAGQPRLQHPAQPPGP